MSLAPIALFVYRRPEHTRRTIASLRNCPEFAASPVFVFSDGARDAAAEAAVAATRAVVAEMLPDAHVTIAIGNRGLAASVISGVDALTERFGRVIVVEDDLIVHARFLEFLNAGLEYYFDIPEVMQVSGFQHDVSGLVGPVLLPLTTSWGWATWRRAWLAFDPDCLDSNKFLLNGDLARRFDLDGAMNYSGMLARQRAGTIDSWAIIWYWTVFTTGGLVVYPPNTLVVNGGFDGSGTHGVASVRRHERRRRDPDMPQLVAFSNHIAINTEAFAKVRRAAQRDFGGRDGLMVKIARKLRAKLYGLMGS